jgi:hypothetical protein
MADLFTSGSSPGFAESTSSKPPPTRGSKINIGNSPLMDSQFKCVKKLNRTSTITPKTIDMA